MTDIDVSHKRDRPDAGQSGEESDDSSSQDTSKRLRQQSPSQHKKQPEIAQGTQNNETHLVGKPNVSLIQDPSTRTVQQKIYEAEGWVKQYDKNKISTNVVGSVYIRPQTLFLSKGVPKLSLKKI